MSASTAADPKLLEELALANRILYREGVVPGTVGSTRWYYVDGTQGGKAGLAEGAVTFGGGLNLAGTWTAHLLLDDDVTAGQRRQLELDHHRRS